MTYGITKFELWEDYSKTKDPEIREKLILEYLHLVKYIAGRMNIYLSTNIEYNDIISFGIFGLIDAIEKFDITKGVKFETYATLRIRGSIIDHIRELDWVPRSLRQKSKELERLYLELETQNGRPPTDKEMAAEIGISMEEYLGLLNDVNIQSLISLEDYLDRNYQLDTNIVNARTNEIPDNHLELIELKSFLGEAIDKLPEKEKTVITLYYYEELTLKEIGAILKVSESRVSQLHTKARLRLKGKLSKYMNDL
ncbi:MAG TPA: FliA/WhiG family RNA polymerase sigma factor [Clostridiaceae bacterium]|jgi:RNA polymerase sigma factor for flagellar operon FliA|nr:FliA/WhiG family RNA polymerase sigma factor [Clostridiaceae bacterium]